MGRCTRIRQSGGKLPAREVVEILMQNLKSFDRLAGEKPDQEQITSRVLCCASCENLKNAASCSVLGSCSTSFKEFYEFHLLRNKGRCPIGRW